MTTKKELEEAARKIAAKWGGRERVRVTVRRVEHEVVAGEPPALVRVREWAARASTDGISIRSGFGPTREDAIEQLRGRMAEVLAAP